MNKKHNQTKSIVAAFLGNSIFGFSFLASKVALSSVTPMILLASRFIAAFIIMNILLLFGVFRIDLRGKRWL